MARFMIKYTLRKSKYEMEEFDEYINMDEYKGGFTDEAYNVMFMRFIHILGEHEIPLENVVKINISISQ